jgi:hypothetical protein
MVMTGYGLLMWDISDGLGLSFVSFIILHGYRSY